ncbi:Leucine-rich repeat-containing protein 16A [Phytophthora cinnamomi]|uniref:Leucine-rich repeat-containing protein 16A n=1 Tax=Phytophthora cinnamomi TaxID=4785 RepID=UPI0035599C88|nr:Leucine-rich repeat-containing protein 16A [Phytophthora cinnamomi]
MVDLSDNDLSGHRAEVLAKLLDESPWATRMSLRLDHSRLHDESAVLLLHSIRGCKTLASLSLEGNGVVKRKAHRKNKLQNEKCYSEGVAPSNPSEIEQAGANALALMLGGVLDCNTYQSAPSRLGAREAAIAAMHSSAAKPLRLKELSLKCEGCYVFGTHIITAAVHALAKPHAQLKMLDVTGNACGDALAQALGEMLPKNKSLQALYWDGNCITVDGFYQFYDGLLQNHTLIMVEMPIQDTRRILEEQQDPPREKLFGILGKIFKVTEKNQVLAKETKERRAEASSARNNSDQRKENHSKDHAGLPAEPIELEIKRELESAGLALEKCASPKLEMPTDDEEDGEEEGDLDLSSASSVRKSLSRQTSARYPTRMQSWSRQSNGDDFITQLNELDSFTSSFSRTPSHM